jgi:hypothetical protein
MLKVANPTPGGAADLTPIPPQAPSAGTSGTTATA